MKIEISRHPNIPEVVREVRVLAIEQYPADSSLVLRLEVKNTLNGQAWPIMPDRELGVYISNDQNVHTAHPMKGKTAQPNESGVFAADVVGEYDYLAWSRFQHGDGSAYSFSEVNQAIAQDQVARLDARGYFNA